MTSEFSSESRFLRLFQSAGSSRPGSEWAMQALHPAGTIRSHGIPDLCSQPGSRARWVKEITVSAPEGVTSSWDLAFVTGRGDNSFLSWARGPSGTDFNKYDPNGYDKGVISVGDGLSEPVDARIVTTGEPVATTTARPSRGIRSFRTYAQSVTATHTGSSLYNEGSVHSTIYPRASYRGPPAITSMGLDTRLVYVPSYTQVSFDETEFTMNAKADVHAARDGIYMVVNPLSDYQDSFVPNGTLVAPPDRSTGGLISALYGGTSLGSLWTGVTGTGAVIPWVGPWVIGDADTATTSGDVGVCVFRGLDPHASLTIKVIVCLETSLYPNSSEVPYIVPRCPLDNDAIEYYTRVLAQVESLYPAKDNFLGFLAPLLAKVASFIIPAAKVAASAAIPVLAKAAVDKLSSKPQPAAPAPAPPKVTARPPPSRQAVSKPRPKAPASRRR